MLGEQSNSDGLRCSFRVVIGIVVLIVMVILYFMYVVDRESLGLRLAARMFSSDYITFSIVAGLSVVSFLSAQLLLFTELWTYNYLLAPLSMIPLVVVAELMI